MWDQLPDEIVEKIIYMAAEMYETERQGPTDPDGQLAALFYDAVYVPCVNFAFENVPCGLCKHNAPHGDAQ